MESRGAVGGSKGEGEGREGGGGVAGRLQHAEEGLCVRDAGRDVADDVGGLHLRRGGGSGDANFDKTGQRVAS